ncbi:PIG-L family deacetylase [Rhodococcus aerolatus]
MTVPLPPLPDDATTVLAVAAHPDDLEYGVASVVARWTDRGARVAYLLLTRGEAGIDTLDPEQAGPLRETEQRAAAAAVGVDDVAFAGLPDGVLEAGLPLRREVARAVRRVRPDVVLAPASQDWGGVPDQADHRALAAVLLDGVRDAGNRWVHRDLGLEPFGGVRWIGLVGDEQATHAVDISATIDRGMAALRAHATYWEVLGSTPEEVLREAAAELGARQGVAAAQAVRVVRVSADA